MSTLGRIGLQAKGTLVGTGLVVFALAGACGEGSTEGTAGEDSSEIRKRRDAGVPKDSGTPDSAPVNGQCGPANGVPTSTAPTSGLCSAGTASSVSGSGPWTWTCAGTNGGTTASCSAPTAAPAPSGIEVPGPSAALFASPFYACNRNFYVATNGSDANDGSAAKPWATVQHANDVGRVAGDCVNVQPGTYPNSFWTVNHGGNLASSTGYVVYRCATLNGCVMSDRSGSKVAIGTNYVVFDGFDFAASEEAYYGMGLTAWDEGGNNSSNHHIWAINNKFHGYGQSGIQLNDGDYYYSIHNAAYGNSHVTCSAQGSGISYVVEKATPGYAPTAADLAWGPFHHVIAWNDVHDNMLTKCGTAANPYDTDGNGIIIDTFRNLGGSNVDYPYQTLVAFNVTHHNGGGGVHIFLSSHVTVANNSAYDNQLDPYNQGTYRPQIGANNYPLTSYAGPDNVFINNIASAVVGSGYLAYNSAFAAGGTGHDGTFQNNVALGDVVMYNSNVFSCTANKCATDPQWVNPGSNFALKATSPAVGYGQTKSFLSAQSVDVGACDHRLLACP